MHTYITLHTYIHACKHACLHTYITLRYITSHHITSHYITYIHYMHIIHYITLHYIALHCIALHFIALHCITMHYIALHCITSHTYIALHYIHTYIHCITGGDRKAKVQRSNPIAIKTGRAPCLNPSCGRLLGSAPQFASSGRGAGRSLRGLEHEADTRSRCESWYKHDMPGWISEVQVCGTKDIPENCAESVQELTYPKTGSSTEAATAPSFSKFSGHHKQTEHSRDPDLCCSCGYPLCVCVSLFSETKRASTILVVNKTGRRDSGSCDSQAST